MLVAEISVVGPRPPYSNGPGVQKPVTYPVYQSASGWLCMCPAMDRRLSNLAMGGRASYLEVLSLMLKQSMLYSDARPKPPSSFATIVYIGDPYPNPGLYGY